MRAVYQTVAAQAAGAWIPVDSLQTAFGLGLFVTVSLDANGLTYEVDLTGDDPFAVPRPVTIFQSTTTATITDPAHGLLSGDSATLSNTGIGIDGTYTITVTDANTYTVTTVTSQTATGKNGSSVITFRVFTHPTLVGQTTRQTGNVAFPVKAVRLKLSAWSAGSATLAVISHGPR